MVERPLTVYDPGLLASPITNTLTERVSPKPTLACVPIICRATRVSMSSRTASNFLPATGTGPSSGKFTRPSRPTTNRSVRF